MSAPIPSFFKIRCGIIVIAFLLFFMLVGLAKQVFAVCPSVDSFTDSDGAWTVDGYCDSTLSQALARCRADTSSSFRVCEGPFQSSGNGVGLSQAPAGTQFYISYISPSGSYHLHVFWAGSSSSCPDSDNDGNPDACDTCPSQTGYKSDILGVLTYCGNTTTQCNGESDTDYEFGFSSDNCTPWQIPDCHVTADCKRDTDGDGIADDTDPDIDGDGILNADDNDIDGDGIPNDKDVDSDRDGDGNPDPTDPCSGNSDPDCVDPCEGTSDASCRDSDGDGVPDSEDPDDDGDGIPDDSETRPYESEADPYVIEDETLSEFKEALKVRFQEFLNKLKTTSLFSIPSRLNNIVPAGSGETKIAVDGGQTYGQHEVDFSGWTQGLAALNALVYMACYFLAIRIIILKR